MRAAEAESGPGVLEALRTAGNRGDPFRVLLLDGAMPGMDGLTVFEAAAREGFPAQAVILMVAAGRARTDSGGCRSLTKPPIQRELREAILSALGAGDAAIAARPPGNERALRSLRILLAEDNPV